MTDPTTDSPDAPPLQVLLVCPRGEHLETVRYLTSLWPRAAQIHWTAYPADALLRARRARLALAIVDARIDRASGCTLIQQLRSHADIDVMTFDDRGSHTQSSWHWPELPRAITWWLQRHLQPAAAIHYQ